MLFNHLTVASGDRLAQAAVPMLFRNDVGLVAIFPQFDCGFNFTTMGRMRPIFAANFANYQVRSFTIYIFGNFAAFSFNGSGDLCACSAHKGASKNEHVAFMGYFRRGIAKWQEASGASCICDGFGSCAQVHEHFQQVAFFFVIHAAIFKYLNQARVDDISRPYVYGIGVTFEPFHQELGFSLSYYAIGHNTFTDADKLVNAAVGSPVMVQPVGDTCFAISHYFYSLLYFWLFGFLNLVNSSKVSMSHCDMLRDVRNKVEKKAISLVLVHTVNRVFFYTVFWGLHV